MTKKYFVSKIEPARAMLMPEMLKCCDYDTYIAEELVQNTIIQAWCVIEDRFKDFLKLPENDPDTDRALFAWMKKIAHRKFLNHLMEKKRYTSLNEECYLAESDDKADDKFKYEALYQFLTLLKKRNRQIMEMYYLRQMKIDDIAKAVGRSPVSVRISLYKSRNYLLSKANEYEGFE